jgi:hypothetical protein
LTLAVAAGLLGAMLTVSGLVTPSAPAAAALPVLDRAKLVTDANEVFAAKPPYLSGGGRNGTYTGGVDCSGLTYWVYARQGVVLRWTGSNPTSAAAQINFFDKVPDSEKLPGDLIFWAPSGSVTHVAIYIGDLNGVPQMIDTSPVVLVTRPVAVRKGTVYKVSGTAALGYFRLKPTYGSFSTGGNPPPAPTNNAPFGGLDVVAKSGSGIRVAGWAADPDTSAPISVRVDISGPNGASTMTNIGLATTFRAGIGNHGYDTVLPSPSEGANSVCVYAIDSSSPSVITLLGCRPVAMGYAPIGGVNVVELSGSRIHVAGWALDRDTTTASIPVHVYVTGSDGVPHVTVVTASVNRPDIAAIFGLGANHGFDVVLPAGTTGNNTVCVYAIDDIQPGGNNPSLGCWGVNIQ